MEWTHSICDPCWVKRCQERHKEGKDSQEYSEPARMLALPYWQICCFCGREHNSRIYVRENENNCPHCPDRILEEAKQSLRKGVENESQGEKEADSV